VLEPQPGTFRDNSVLAASIFHPTRTPEVFPSESLNWESPRQKAVGEWVAKGFAKSRAIICVRPDAKNILAGPIISASILYAAGYRLSRQEC
jgi:hypothetical protein